MFQHLVFFICFLWIGCEREPFVFEPSECCNNWGCVDVGEEICIWVEEQERFEHVEGYQELEVYGGIGVCNASGTIEAVQTCEVTTVFEEDGGLIILYGCASVTESSDGNAVKCIGEGED